MANNRIRQYILGTNWLKTLRVNFYYFPLKQAVKLPILVSKRTILQELGGGVKIEGPFSTGMLLFGYQGLGTQDNFYERSVWQVSGSIVLKGSRIGIGRGSKLSVSGTLLLGDRFTISGRSTIICNKYIHFGDNVLLSWDVLLMDTDNHIITNEYGKVINEEKPIVIGDNVWIGCRAIILKGTSIPSNSVVAAGSIITGRMEEENSIYSSDRKILKKNISWQR